MYWLKANLAFYMVSKMSLNVLTKVSKRAIRSLKTMVSSLILLEFKECQMKSNEFPFAGDRRFPEGIQWA